MLDREDEEALVVDDYEEFQQLYHPIHKEHFADCFKIENNRFFIDEKDIQIRK